MSAIEWVLDRLFKRADIYKNGVIYLTRWFIGFSPSEPGVWQSRWYNLVLGRLLLGPNIGNRWKYEYLHKMYQSDDDRDPHDHPWDFETRVIWNGYNDEGYTLMKMMRVLADMTLEVIGKIRSGPYVDALRFLSRRFRSAEWIHQVKKHNDGPTWTFVRRGPYRREWGFVLADGTWVYWREYLDFWGPNPYDPDSPPAPEKP